jgi:GTPase
MTHSSTFTTRDAAPRAVLCAVSPSHQDEAETEASLKELAHLLTGLGAVPVAALTQRQAQAPGPLVFGAGKLVELRNILADLLPEEDDPPPSEGRVLLVFDGELTPGQQRNLTREFGVEVLDRTQVILRIFSQRARTRTAQLEIELAGLLYESPRIRDDEALGDKQAGGGGRGAKGHTNVELRKQEIRKRLSVLREEIAKAAKAQTARRARREQVSAVALVGYTNAGKSSWMRALTGSEVLVQNALFATLDTTVRVLHPPTQPRIVVADTVGFLRNLPNHLLASFRSTLDEALDADLLLIVIDGSDTQWQAHLETTRKVLSEVGVQSIAVTHIVNKVDNMSAEERVRVEALLPDAIFVSSRSATDVKRVHQLIVEFFEQQLSEAELLVPFDRGALRAEIRATARVVAETFDETGGLIRVRADAAQIARWRSLLSGE